jgi:flagellar biosynthesis chaperone FliJ
VARPPPPVYKNDFQEKPSLDFKPRAEYVPRVEFKPDVAYAPPASNPINEYEPTADKQNIGYTPTVDIKRNIGYVPKDDFTPNAEFVPKVEFEPNVEYMKKSPAIEKSRHIPLSSSLPAIHVSTAIVQSNGEDILEQERIQEKDHVLGKTRSTREMYEERLARINLVPLDLPEQPLTNQELVATSLCSSLESFAWDKSCNVHNTNKNDYLDKLKTCMKQMKMLTNQKEELEKNFERERRDWKRKYEEQQKVANAYQKLEDRYRRQVQELQEALKQCKCTDIEARKVLFLGQSW